MKFRETCNDLVQERERAELGKHLHTCLIPIVTEADDNQTLLLSEDGLIHRPSWMQMWQEIRHDKNFLLVTWSLAMEERVAKEPSIWGWINCYFPFFNCSYKTKGENYIITLPLLQVLLFISISPLYWYWLLNKSMNILIPVNLWWWVLNWVPFKLPLNLLNAY